MLRPCVHSNIPTSNLNVSLAEIYSVLSISSENRIMYGKRGQRERVKVEKKKMTQLKLRSQTIFILINLLKD